MKRADLIAIALALLVAGIWTSLTPASLNPDGVSYLDLARRTAAGHPAELLGGYWSPLYPVLLLAVTPLSAELLMAGIRALNLVIFLSWILAFRWTAAGLGLNIELLTILGAALALRLTPPGLVTPDLLAATLFIAAIGAFANRRQSAAGTLLGLAYLAKAPWLWLGLLLISAWSIVERRFLWKSAMAMAIGVILWALPLSIHHGSITVGESARYNYHWMVLGDPVWPDGRVIVPQPYPSAADRGGVTYWPWYDPASVHHLSESRVDVQRQLHAFRRGAAAAMPLLLLFVPLAALALLDAVSSARRVRIALLAVALAGVGIFLPVHFEPRFALAPAALMVMLAARGVFAARQKHVFLWVVIAAAVIALPQTRLRLADEPRWPSTDAVRAAGLRSGDAFVAIGTAHWGWPARDRLRVVDEASRRDGDERPGFPLVAKCRDLQNLEGWIHIDPQWCLKPLPFAAE